MTSFTLHDIYPILSTRDVIVGDLDRRFSSLDDASNVSKDSLDWLGESCSDPASYIRYSQAQTIILPHSLKITAEQMGIDKTFVYTENPRLLFARIGRKLFIPEQIFIVDPSVIIDPRAEIDDKVYIGPYAVIGVSRVRIGSVVLGNCTIGDQVDIGKGVFIKSGARIGNEGFGFVRNTNNELEKFPQIGRVLIMDNVEIGANTCIDRGALSTTFIGKGTKIDNLCQIAHNVCIGSNCFIAGNVSIGGSCKIGDNVHIGPSVTIHQGVKIGNGAFISMGSVVTKNVKPQQRIIGYPAIDMERFVIERNAVKHLIKSKE